MVDEKITGLMVYYYFVCRKKLWLFGNGFEMEEESELVHMGKIIDETSYQSERKHIMINEEINIDFIENAGVIHEIKKSRKVEQASIWQVKYYLYYLKNRGVVNVLAKLDYPLIKKTEEILLSESDEAQIIEILRDIARIISSPTVPEGQQGRICKKCAYFDLCKL